MILVALTADDYLRREAYDGPEVYALFLVAATGGVVMASANDLIVLFVGLETLSLAFYVLAASYRSKAGSAESGIKYFVLGGFSSAFLLYGIALVYGAVGTTNISEMVDALSGSVPVERNDALVLAGIALLLVGLGFKVAAVPFHVWTPDVYQGAPTPVTAFMASVGKVAAFAALLRVFVVGLPFYRDDWRPAIWILAVLSLVVGSFLAVVQTDVKRMLAYSSISHAGFVLVGVEAAAHRAGEADAGLGVPSALVYLLAYAVMVAGTFGVVALVSRTRRHQAPTSTRSRASASRAPSSPSPSPCSSSPRPACRSRPASSPSSASSGPASTSTATRWRSSPWSRRSSPRSCTCGSWSAPGWPTRRPRASWRPRCASRSPPAGHRPGRRVHAGRRHLPRLAAGRRRVDDAFAR